MPKEGNRPGTRRKHTYTERPLTLSTHTNQHVAAPPLAAADNDDADDAPLAAADAPLAAAAAPLAAADAPLAAADAPLAAAPSREPSDGWYGRVNNDGSVIYINKKSGMVWPGDEDSLLEWLGQKKPYWEAETYVPGGFSTLWRDGGKRKSKKRKSKKRKSKKRKSKKRKSKKRKSKK
jgi:hypothetical protein